MRFGLLGPMAVTDGEGRQLALGAPKQRALLAILLLHANQDVTSDRLIELLWGEEAPRSAAKSLQVHVSRLRQALGDAGAGEARRLTTTSAGYRLEVAPDELEVTRFERLAGEANERVAAEQWGAAADTVARALEVWRGSPLSDFVYESFAQAEITRLDELRLLTLEQRVTVEMALGHEGAMIGELETLIREHPYRERLHGQLMLALYRTGRQADALAAFRDARRRLSEELGIEPSNELARLHEAILAHDPSLDPLPQGDAEQPTNLPAQTRPLIGRRDERSELLSLLRDGGGRVITLTGIGGIGKTRLALAAAADALREMPGGAFLVRLAGISDPQSILPMVAEAIGLNGAGEEPLQTLLATRLGRRPTLLILDNFEQLVDAAGIVGELAAAAEHLRIVVTSQISLRIGAETVIPVGPLRSDDAASLFVERIRTRDREFASGEPEDAIIASICERVDGMPLAIELAAARARGLGLRELDRRLEAPLGLLTRGDRDLPERQRSLRAAIEWSQTLLSADDHMLFIALGACAGPVPLEMVAAITGTSADETATLDRLEALLESSFVRRQQDPVLGLRFLMPQALRNYAAERLTESGAEGSVRSRHAGYVAEVAWDCRLWKWGATDEQHAALRAIEAEIRPAVAWAREHDPALHVRMCGGLANYWIYRGVIPEAAEQLGQVVRSGVGAPAERARCMTIQAQCLRLGGTEDGAEQRADVARAEWQRVGDAVERALGECDLSWVYRWAGRYDKAIEICEQLLPILRATGNPRFILRGLTFLAMAFADVEDVENTERVLDEADALTDGDNPPLDNVRGDCALSQGDNARAVAMFAKSLEWSSRNGEAHQAMMDLRCIGMCLGNAGHADAALEVIELIHLHEEHTGRAGNISVAVELLRQARERALALAGPGAEAEAISRAQTVPTQHRIQRVLGLSVALSQEANGAPAPAANG
jgi:predicted ATPase/DNA-binding SARP family transcriptional activator